MITQQARSDVYINGQQAGQELDKLAVKAEKLKTELVEMKKANDKSGFDKKQKELKEVSKEMVNLHKQAFDLNKVLNNLKGTSLNDLYKAQRELNREMRQLPSNSKEYKNLEKEAGRLANQINKVKTSQKGLNSALGISGRLWNGIKGMLPIVGLTSAVALIGRLGRGLFDLKLEMDGDAKRAAIVFGDQLGYVKSQAEKLAKQMGLTNNQFIANAAATADLLIPLNFTREQSAKMSVELQSLTGALDEWTGGQLGATEVSNILTKAMLGENEQLKQLGIAIKMDSEEFRDLVKVKMENNDVTKAQAQAMATLELIQIKSADAQRAYITEGNQLLRLQKEISLVWRQIKENIVSRFDIPVAKLMDQEAQKANILAAQLMNTNIEEGKRKEIFDQMKQLYPDILNGIDQENIDTKKLVENLAQYNTEMGKKIILANIEKEQEKILAKQADRKAKLLNLQSDILLKINESSAYLTENGVSKSVLGDFEQLRDLVLGSDQEAISSGRLKTLLDIIVEKSVEAGQKTGVTADLLRNQFLAYIPSINMAGEALRDHIKDNSDALDNLSQKHKIIMESFSFIPDATPDEKQIFDKAAYDAYLYSKKIKEEILKRKTPGEHPIDWIFQAEEEVDDDIPWLKDWTDNFWKQFDNSFTGSKSRLDAMLASNLISLQDYNEQVAELNHKQSDEELSIIIDKMRAKIQLTQQIESAITDIIVDGWINRKQASEDYHDRMKDLEQNYKEGRISLGEYEKQISQAKIEQEERELEAKKDVWKHLLVGMLDYLRKFAHAKIAEATIASVVSKESLASFGIAGVAKAALFTALIEGAYGLAKSKISQFSEGRYPVTGATDNRTYMARDAGIATTGIYRSPALVAERGTEMIIDNPTFTNLSMNRPDIIQDIMNMRMPQYAEGRFPQSTTINNSSSDAESRALLKTLVSQNAVLLSELKAGRIKTVVDDYQIREIRNRIKVLNDIERSISR